MHGYAARDGLGMTRTKYHIRPRKPKSGSNSQVNLDLKLTSTTSPLFRHRFVRSASSRLMFIPLSCRPARLRSTNTSATTPPQVFFESCVVFGPIRGLFFSVVFSEKSLRLLSFLLKCQRFRASAGTALAFLAGASPCPIPQHLATASPQTVCSRSRPDTGL